MCRNLAKLLIWHCATWADYLNNAYRSNERRTNGAEATNDATNEYNERRNDGRGNGRRRDNERSNERRTRKQRERQRRTRQRTKIKTTNDATNDITKTKQQNTATNRTTHTRQYKCNNLIIIPQAIASAIGIILRLYSYKCQRNEWEWIGMPIYYEHIWIFWDQNKIR